MDAATREHDLTKGSLYKQILLFSLPLIASNLLQVLFNMSDIAVSAAFPALWHWGRSAPPLRWSACSPAF